MPTDDPFEAAASAHERGDLAEAEVGYRAILEGDPDDAEVGYLLGLLLLQSGRAADAAARLHQVIQRHDDHAPAWIVYGQARSMLRQPAIDAFRKAISIDPVLRAEVEPLLAGELIREDLPIEALEVLLQSRWDGRGHDRALLDAAVRRADALGLGEESLERLVRESIARSADAEVVQLTVLGLVARRRFAEAISVLRRAIASRPDDIFLRCNLGSCLVDHGAVAQGLAEFESALKVGDHAILHYNRARALAELWRSEESSQAYVRALDRDAGHRESISNYLMGLNYLDELDGSTLCARHREVAAGLRPSRTVAASVQRRRRAGPIRVGFVSPDLRRHAVATFIEPLIENLDLRLVEPVAFPNGRFDDEVTGRLRRRFAQWISVAELDDDAAELVIRDAGIDVLVDLGGHTALNRLALFARRPCEVQVTWLGYPNTTGLPEVAWRLVDSITDPAGSESHMVERPLRIEPPFLCYRPSAPPPRRAPRPNGPLRFGSFNKLHKLSLRCVRNWASVLRAVDGSTLTLKNHQLAVPEVRDRVLRTFADESIAADRINLMPATESFQAHLDSYSRIDVALDTFPYHGTTTTCEALWAGVPVVTIAGKEHRSRVGVSLLGAVGLGDLVGADDETFVRKTVELAGDLPRLSDLHASLGRRMTESPLCDGASFARRFERAMGEIIDR